MRVGVLALQGDYAAHARALERAGCEVVFVREARDVRDLEGLVLPGGESTTQLKLLRQSDLLEPLSELVQSDKPVLATCAGLILIAHAVTGPRQESLDWIDVDVERNAWGRQVHSFEARADEDDTELVLIRAPRIRRVGEGVDVLLHFQSEPVLVRAGNVWGATYHPELSADSDLHARVFA